MTSVVSAAQMRAMDEETITRIGVPGAVLMENAGRGVVEVIRRLQTGEGGGEVARDGEIVVVAGPGNNGGDGFVVARSLHTAGVAVRLVLCAPREKVRGDALLHLRAAEACGVLPVVCAGDGGAEQAEEILGRLPRGAVIVDALLGTGLTKAVAGPLRRVIAAVNRSAAVRVAVDLPSGLDADLGVPRQTPGQATGKTADGKDPVGDADPAIVQADHTVTFAFPKLGLCGAPGFTYAGKLHVVDIGIPAALCEKHGVHVRLLDATCLAPALRPVPPLSHKGTHGHLLIVAGSAGKTGAALLCARGAMQVGVGLCTIAAPPSAQQVLQGRILEAMTQSYGRALDEDARPGSSGEATGQAVAQAIAQAIAAELIALSQGKRALAVGPGLPKRAPMRQVLLRLLAAGDQPMLLDADALNLLADDLPALKSAPRPLVLTPHPGEAARLLHSTTDAIQRDRLHSAQELCRATGAVVVLKGARSLIVAPPGPAAGADGPLRVSISPTGNGAMGSGGMGDVLSGMIGALLTAGCPPYEAACAGVYLHGLAGDVLFAQEPAGTILLAGQLCDAIPAARRAAGAA